MPKRRRHAVVPQAVIREGHIRADQDRAAAPPDLLNLAAFRDMSWLVGVLNVTRLQEFRTRYEGMVKQQQKGHAT